MPLQLRDQLEAKPEDRSSLGAAKDVPERSAVAMTTFEAGADDNILLNSDAQRSDLGASTWILQRASLFRG